MISECGRRRQQRTPELESSIPGAQELAPLKLWFPTYSPGEYHLVDSEVHLIADLRVGLDNPKGICAPVPTAARGKSKCEAGAARGWRHQCKRKSARIDEICEPVSGVIDLDNIPKITSVNSDRVALAISRDAGWAQAGDLWRRVRSGQAKLFVRTLAGRVGHFHLKIRWREGAKRRLIADPDSRPCVTIVCHTTRLLKDPRRQLQTGVRGRSVKRPLIRRCAAGRGE